MFNSRFAIWACISCALSAFGRCGRGTAVGSERPTTALAPTSSGAPAQVAMPGDEPPLSMRVPAELASRTAIEPSAIVYSPPLGRYVVVSDDTGRKDESSFHVPWLFAMNAAGELDADPLAIAGIDGLNDAEAIAAAPDGTLFLCTSHSPDHKGRTRPDRAMLLELAVEGRSLRVTGRIDLRDVSVREGEAPPEGALLAAAGLDPAGRLDIEAVAYQKGDLFIGLKSPLTADGRAVVLRLSRVAEVVRRGRILPGEVRRFTALRLSVAGPTGADVAEGISELLFLPDGSLLLLANSPKGMPRDGGGAIWRIATTAQGMSGEPVLVRRFAGLKPEGAALSPDASQVVVVFDRDRAPPMFTRIPVARITGSARD